MSVRLRLALATAVVLCGFFAFATPAHAQSQITGVVKDESGAVMPGVTVEASSPVLIEGTRSTVTDTNGGYRLVDLRPGTYDITFTLTGFNVVKRAGLELPANFVATVDIALSVGTLQESVTVTGASPLVDVQSNVKQQTLTRDLLDAVPTARTIQGLGQLVPGVVLSTPDVGGSRAMQQTYFAVRGTGAAQTIVMVDGMMTNGLMGDGAVNAYHNEAMVQEAVYMTSGGNAETMTAGVNMNLVPKDGGNRFSGGLKYAKPPAAWQGNNLDDDLIARGVRAVDRIENFYEFNVEQGGPIVKNKLWFYGAYRKARYDKPVANTFVLPSGGNPLQAFNNCIGVGGCEQGVSPEQMDNPVARLTWQMSENNKFAVYYDRALRLRAAAMGANTDPRTASVEWNTPIFATGAAKMTSTLSSSILLENGFSFNRERYDNLYQPGIFAERGTPEWYQRVRRNDVSNDFLWSASSAQLGNYPDRYNLMSSMSYVTGAHSVKVGAIYGWGKYYRWNNANGDLYQTYNNGAPFQVTVLNTPLQVQEDLDAQLGFYAQDSWRVNNLTVNYGLRWDYLVQRVKGQPAQSGRFAESPAYDDIDVPVWSDFSPRLSAVWDIFGNGKTAVRTGLNRFMTAQTTGMAALYSPTALTTANLTWQDLNGDDIAQGERGCTFGTVGCEMNFAQLPANFGRRALSTPDDDLQRPGQWSFNLGATQELFNRLTLSLEWYRNSFFDLTERNNVLRDFDSYVPVTVASPLDGTPITVFNVRPQFLSAVQNVDVHDPDISRVYNGFELGYQARLGKGARLFGGFNLERTISNTCSAGTDPNFTLFCDQAESGIPWQKQFKISGSVPLPIWGINVSTAIQSLNGYLIGSSAVPYGGFTFGTGLAQPQGQATFWQVTRTTRYAADCTGPCRPGELVIPGLTTATLNVPLRAPESEYLPRINQVDLSFSKAITYKTARILPKVDIFNVLNSNDYSAVATSQFGTAAYLRPSVILQGRLIRLGFDMTW